MAETPSSIPAPIQVRLVGQSGTHWFAALLMGLLLLAVLLLLSWLLRACVPVDPAVHLSATQAPAPPAPPAPVDPTPALKTALQTVQAEGKTLQAELTALSGDLKSRLAHCKPPEAKAPPAKPPPPPAPLPADRWARKDLAMLKGCWRLGRDTQGSIAVGGGSERCDVKAGRICFGADGTGQRETTAVCPRTGTVRCSAPITARFGNDDSLATTQPPVRCTPTGTVWNGPPNSLSCRRVSDTLAICQDRLRFQHEFRRE